MSDKKNSFKAVEPHLYERVYWPRKAKKPVVGFYWVKRIWTGEDVNIFLSSNLRTAKKVMWEYEEQNDKKTLDLDAKRREYLAAKRAENQRPEAPPTVASWLVEFRSKPEFLVIRGRKHKRKGAPRSAVTIKGDEHKHQHLTCHLGSKRLDSLTDQDLIDYVAKRRGDTIQRWGKPTKAIVVDGKVRNIVQDGSIKNEMVALKSALDVAAKYHTVAKLDFGVVSLSAGTKDRVLSLQEQEKLFREMQPWFLQMATVAIESSISLGDLINLRESDIHWDRNFIKITRRKTGVPQVVPLTNTLRSTLEQIIAEKSRAKVKPFLAQHQGLVFLQPNGKPYPKTMLQAALKRAVKRSRIPHISFHGLRHTIITRWHLQKIPTKGLVKVAGWTNTAMLDRYANLIDDDIPSLFGVAPFSNGFDMEKKARYVVEITSCHRWIRTNSEKKSLAFSTSFPGNFANSCTTSKL